MRLTIPQHQVTLSGNTAGGLAALSSGTVTLAGGNNITLSQVGNAVTISGPNAGGAQTGISGLANSQTTYTSGTVSLSELGALTIRSSTGQHFQFEVPGTSSLSATGEVSISVNGSTISIGAPAQTVQTQNVVDLTLSGNTSGALALVSSGTLTLAGGNNITLSQAGNAVTISGASQSVQAETQTFIGGISASDTLYTSGTVRITGVGGGVTVSSNTGQRIDISVAAQSVQPETQTAISGIANSQTTYTSGTVSLSELGAITIRSTTGNQFQFSVNSQTVQTQNVVDVSLSGNTSGALALISSGTMTLAGGNNVTLSQAGNAVTISAASQSVQAETQTFVAGIQNSQTTYTSGTVNLSVVAGNLTIRSTTGQAFQFSMSQTVQAETQTAVSGIANSQTTYTSGTVSLSELGAITIRSTTGNQFQFSVNSQSVQAETQTFVAGIRNSETTYTSGTVNLSVVGGALTIRSTTGNAFQFSASQSVQAETQTAVSGIANSQTTYTSGTVSLSELGAITIRSTTGNQFQLSVNSQTVQTQNLVDVTLSGNTSGAMALVSSGTLTLAGGNNITLSQAGNAVTISAAGGPETQVAISGLANSQTTYTSGTVSLSELGAITIRSTTGNQFQFSVNSQTLQTSNVHNVTLSGNSTSAGAGYIQISSGTLTLAGGNNVTLSQNGNAVTISAFNQSVQAETQTFVAGIQNSQTTYTSGTVNLSVVAGNLTIRSTTGQAFQFSMSQTVQAETQTAISGIANSQTTYTSGTVSLSELGAITIRSTTGNQFQFSVNSQTVQTQNFVALSATNTLYTSGTVLLTGSNLITVKSSAAGQTIILDATNQNLSVGLSNIGNTSGDTTVATGSRFVLAGGNNITLSASTAAGATTITVSAPNLGAGAMSAGVSNLGNTAGSTGITGTRLVLAGTNMISLSQSTDANGGTVSINATQSVQTQGVPLMGVSTGGATSGDTTVNSGTRFVLVGTNITMSQGTAANATTVTVSAPATSSLSGTGGIQISSNASTISIGYKQPLADWENMPVGNATLMSLLTAISKTPFYWNAEIPGYLTAKSLAIKVSLVTASQPLSASVHLGVYTFVNSTSAALLGSISEAFVVSSASSVSLSGIRNLIFTGIGTHATLSTISGGEYLFGMMVSATATNAMNFSIMGAATAGAVLGGIYPGTNNLSTGIGQGIQVMAGRGSSTVNLMPANVSSADLTNQGAGVSMPLYPWIYIRS